MEKQTQPDKQNTGITAAIYSRCSTKNFGQDTGNQAAVLREYCHKMGYNLVGEYSDYESGGTINRPEFRKMFDDARRRKFDLVVFWSLDRFSREGTRATIALLQELESYGVQYKSYTEQYIDSSGIFKDVIICLLSTLARQEKIRLSERVRAGLEKSRTKYGRVGGRPRIGQDKINAIAKLRAQGLSLRKIAKEIGIHHGTVAEYATDC